MSNAPASHARWHRHVNAVNPPRELCAWLTLQTSLTDRLRAHCREFRVQPLLSRQSLCLPDEYNPIGLFRCCRVRVREVLLCCDDRPMVLAHTVLPLRASDWPMFRSLGARSLGTILFGDPQVERGQPQFARLHHTHPLAQRVAAAIPDGMIKYPLHARRCLFRRKNGLMLVTEIFLPDITKLHNLVDA